MFLARAYAQDFETKELSLDEAKASSRNLREAGKAISNRSILTEVRDRDTFLAEKKTKKERQKAEQVELYASRKQPPTVESKNPDKIEMKSGLEATELGMPEVFDYEGRFRRVNKLTPTGLETGSRVRSRDRTLGAVPV